MFTHVHSCLSIFTPVNSVYLCLPLLTRVSRPYVCSQLFTRVYLCLQQFTCTMFTSVFFCLHLFTVFPCLLVFIYVTRVCRCFTLDNLCLPLYTHLYLYSPPFTLAFYLCLPMLCLSLVHVYLCLHLFTYVYHCLIMFTFVYH